MTTANRDVAVRSERRVIGNVVRGSIGNLIEWYDWYAYAAFSVYFAGVFFPSGDPTAQLLNTAGIFAVGFLMRPLGAIFLGAYLDRHGRRAGLLLTLGLMAVGTMTIAFMPGFASIGLLAPILVLVGRLLQGLSAGVPDKSGGSLGTLTSRGRDGVAGRHEPESKRTFYFSLTTAALRAAIVIALFVAAARRPQLVPRGVQNLVEVIVQFIREQIALQVIGREGLPWVPFLTSMFAFILIGNIFEAPALLE